MIVRQQWKSLRESSNLDIKNNSKLPTSHFACKKNFYRVQMTIVFGYSLLIANIFMALIILSIYNTTDWDMVAIIKFVASVFSYFFLLIGNHTGDTANTELKIIEVIQIFNTFRKYVLKTLIKQERAEKTEYVRNMCDKILKEDGKFNLLAVKLHENFLLMCLESDSANNIEEEKKRLIEEYLKNESNWNSSVIQFFDEVLAIEDSKINDICNFINYKEWPDEYKTRYEAEKKISESMLGMKKKKSTKTPHAPADKRSY